MNYYIENVKEIAKLGAKENVDWSVAVSMYDQEHGYPCADKDEMADMRSEFYQYIKGRAYNSDGEEIEED